MAGAPPPHHPSGDQSGKWRFDALGPQRDYEEPDRYLARRKADRLDPGMIGRYLEALGIPVHRSGWQI